MPIFERPGEFDRLPAVASQEAFEKPVIFYDFNA